MRKLLPILFSVVLAADAQAQISITANDMPVVGDTLRYSTVLGVGFNVDLNDTGANKVWNFDTMTPLIQRVDEYKTAIQVNILYASISPTAYGYKVADTLGAGGGSPIPISLTEVYTFFNKKGTAPNNRYVAEGFAAKISGVPIPAAYSNEDEIFFFPLEYGDMDTSDYYLNINVPTFGRMVQNGERITKVDAWGTIKTPYHTTAKNCIRVRTEVNGMDSIILTSLPLPPIGIPRQTVDYYWLVEGEHYPALWITASMVASTETITAVRYRDLYRPLAIQDTKQGNTVSQLEVFPNPANNEVRLNIPADAKHYTAEVFDMQGKQVAFIQDKHIINIANLAAGNYIIRVTMDNGTGYAPFVKQ